MTEYAYTSSWAQLDTVHTTVDAGARTKQQDYTYSSNGDVTNELSPTGAVVAYTLDSRGNRLDVTGGSYNGHTKRYDADGRAREFHRDTTSSPWLVGDLTKTTYMFFVHDPRGSQVLAVSATLQENANRSDEHVIHRDQSTSVTAANATRFMRYQDRKYGKFWNGVVYEGEDGRIDRVRDESFSLEDGLANDTWSVVVPFDTSARSPLALEAPEPAISDLLGVLPMDVLPPLDLTPPTSNPGDVAPPTETPAPSEEAANSGASEPAEPARPSVTSPLPGVGTLDGFRAPSTPNETTDPEAPAASVSTDLATTNDEPLDLAPPTSALPSGVQGVNATSVTTPSTTPGATPGTPPAGDPDGVRPPSSSTAPSVGPSPSDGPGNVTPPAGAPVGSPAVPPVAPSTPDPVIEGAVDWDARLNPSHRATADSLIDGVGRSALVADAVLAFWDYNSMKENPAYAHLNEPARVLLVGGDVFVSVVGGAAGIILGGLATARSPNKATTVTVLQGSSVGGALGFRELYRQFTHNRLGAFDPPHPPVELP